MRYILQISSWRETKKSADDHAFALRQLKTAKVSQQSVYRYFANRRGLSLSTRHNAPLKKADLVLIAKTICAELRKTDSETDYDTELKYFKEGMDPPFKKGHFLLVRMVCYSWFFLARSHTNKFTGIHKFQEYHEQFLNSLMLRFWPDGCPQDFSQMPPPPQEAGESAELDEGAGTTESDENWSDSNESESDIDVG